MNSTNIKNSKVIVLIQLIFLSFSLNAQVLTGAEQLNKYLPHLKSGKGAMVVNQTSVIGSTHLVDTLVKLGVDIQFIFAPEHGFRGNYSAGAKVLSGIDSATGLKVISLYGKNKKPSPQHLKSLQWVLFDVQDVGARFYTYISTLHYVMEACAENNITLIILDRPNPNGHFIDGPVLDTAFKSFVGMHPVPVVHGLTIAEYAQMINGERWLANGAQCKLQIVTCNNYNHKSPFKFGIKPSPNLPNLSSIYLYPSLCFFEGTNQSVGRGTDYPFECVGSPKNSIGDFYFTPKSIAGVADKPMYENKVCRGFLLKSYGENIAPYDGKLNLYWLIELYKNASDKDNFFNNFFDKLAGTDQLRKQIIAGTKEADICLSWQKDLELYAAKRTKYLLYP